MGDNRDRAVARGCMYVVALAALVCATALAVGARWGAVTGIVTLLLLVAACAIAWAALMGGGE